MKSEINKYKKMLEIKEQKTEYEKLKGFSGEKRLIYKQEEDEKDYFNQE